MALSLGTLCVAALRQGGMPQWLAAMGAVSAALLAGLAIPVCGDAPVVPVAAAVSLLSARMITAGVFSLRRG